MKIVSFPNSCANNGKPVGSSSAGFGGNADSYIEIGVPMAIGNDVNEPWGWDISFTHTASTYSHGMGVLGGVTDGGNGYTARLSAVCKVSGKIEGFRFLSEDANQFQNGTVLIYGIK